MVGMIDIHAHILPGLDDGPKEWDESLAMARQAAADGITTIVATPHVIAGRYENSCEVVAERVQEFQERLSRSRLEIRVLPGGEVFFEDGLVGAIKSGRVPSVCNAGKYALIEFPLGGIPAAAERMVFELAVNGVTPVIAHPERNEDVIRDPNNLYRLVERGALAQVNAGSLIGEFGRRVLETAQVLVTHRMVQIIASDAHSSRHRPFRLAAALNEARRLVGREQAEAMVEDIPAKVIAGEDVPLQSPKPYSRRKGFFARLVGATLG
ncbi:MAG: hypothetical protein HPY71_00180 [Firmicutes bacterium]|nr:hypothetical protein [Bacillota bacterium]